MNDAPMNDAPRLSGLVICRDEIANIERCLGSLALCDEVVVVDSGSTDGTAEAARRYTSRVYVEPWRGYAGQKEFALALCRGRWVLWLDADEALTPQLARSVEEAVAEGAAAPAAAYSMIRRVHYLGRWIRFGAFGRDRVVRLFRRGQARFSDHAVHEGLIVDGPIGRLEGILEHYSYRDLAHHRAKIDVMTSLWADDAWKRGRRAAAWDPFFRPLARWFRILVLQGGFLDGWRGWVIAAMAARYVRSKYRKLRAKGTKGAR